MSDTTLKVFVYFNLHRKLWSIRCEEKGHPMKGRVIAHRVAVDLYDVTPKVSQAGRARVIRERRKNVHAGLLGTWAEAAAPSATSWSASPWQDIGGFEITYNPYKYTSFVFKHADEEEYYGSASASLRGRSVTCRGLTNRA